MFIDTDVQAHRSIRTDQVQVAATSFASLFSIVGIALYGLPSAAMQRAIDPDLDVRGVVVGCGMPNAHPRGVPPFRCAVAATAEWQAKRPGMQAG